MPQRIHNYLETCEKPGIERCSLCVGNDMLNDFKNAEIVRDRIQEDGEILLTRSTQLEYGGGTGQQLEHEIASGLLDTSSRMR